MSLNKVERRARIKLRIRKIVSGTAQKPRMSVFRSNRHISVQLIDDLNGVTLAAASSRDKEVAEKVAGLNKVQVAALSANWPPNAAYRRVSPKYRSTETDTCITVE